jgi:glutathionyl-hydroquinone reductase
MASDGWPFANVDSFPGADVDPLIGARHVKDVYLRSDPAYGGRFVALLCRYPYSVDQTELLFKRFTVPVLFDKKTEKIVNNESSEIIRMLNSEFNHLLPKDKAEVDLYPKDLQKEIDEVNEWMYSTVNGE